MTTGAEAARLLRDAAEPAEPAEPAVLNVDVSRLPFVGRRVDLSDLIDANEVALLLGLSHRNSVTTYLRRYREMPRPVLERAHGKTRLWLRSEIVRWANSTGRHPTGDAA